jgi:hypothetical protein
MKDAALDGVDPALRPILGKKGSFVYDRELKQWVVKQVRIRLVSWAFLGY